MTEIEGSGFTEIVKYEIDGSYMIAHGWTQSTGQGGGHPYTLPAGWAFDARYQDGLGGHGSHGGCRSCVMTLVHLISTQPIDPCSGVVCETECFGVDVYSTICKDGVCVKGIRIEEDAAVCGYEEPAIDEPIVVNDPATPLMLIGIIIIVVIFLYKR